MITSNIINLSVCFIFIVKKLRSKAQVYPFETKKIMREVYAAANCLQRKLNYAVILRLQNKMFLFLAES